MPCYLEVSLLDRVINYIKISIPDYQYTRNDFVIVQNHVLEIENWNLKLDKPDIEFLETIECIKKCPKTCINCLSERIDGIEDLITRVEQLENVILKM